MSEPRPIKEAYYDEVGNYWTIYEDGSSICLSAELIEDDRDSTHEEPPTPPPESSEPA